MIPCSVTKIKIPSATSLLQEHGYSAWETTSCSSSYVDGTLSKESPSSAIFQECCWPRESTANISLQSQQLGQIWWPIKFHMTQENVWDWLFNQSRCRGALMGQIYSASPRKKKHIFFPTQSFCPGGQLLSMFSQDFCVSSSDWNYHAVNPFRLARKLGIQGTCTL